MANAAADFAVPHPTFNGFTLVAMIVPTIMYRGSHPLSYLATSLAVRNHIHAVENGFSYTRVLLNCFIYSSQFPLYRI